MHPIPDCVRDRFVNAAAIGHESMRIELYAIALLHVFPVSRGCVCNRIIEVVNRFVGVTNNFALICASDCHLIECQECFIISSVHIGAIFARFYSSNVFLMFSVTMCSILDRDIFMIMFLLKVIYKVYMSLKCVMSANDYL